MENNELAYLREYLELRINSLEKLLEQRSQLITVANERDRILLSERLAGMNEFRKAMQDQTDKFADSKEMELRIRPLESFMQETRAKIGITMWGIAVFFTVVQVVLRMLWNK